MATAEEIRNAARAKAGLAEAKTNAAARAAADKAAADARAKAARDKAARDKAARDKAAKGVENQTTTTTTPEVSAEEAARLAAQEIENARLQTQRVDWTEQLSLLFKNYGLESLAPLIKQYVQDGYSADTVTLKLQDAPEYQRRFAGNESRKKAGLPVLSPAEYLATESAYKQIMRTAGLPEGFYDSYDDGLF